jgi:hypothetical protein
MNAVSEESKPVSVFLHPIKICNEQSLNSSCAFWTQEWFN